MPKIHYEYFACPNETCSMREGESSYIVQIAELEKRRCPCGQKLTEENRVAAPVKVTGGMGPIKLKPALVIWSGVAIALVLLLTLLLSPKPPSIELVETGLNFEPTLAGAERRSRITVRNIGKGRLEIRAETSGSKAFDVEVEKDPITIPRGSSTDLTVVFRPLEGEPMSGKLTVSSNDSKAGPQEVALSGSFAVPLGEALGLFKELDQSSTVLRSTP